MPFVRWQFIDPTPWTVNGQAPFPSYTLAVNPNAMSSPFARKNITALTTTAVGGRALLYEGNTTPHEMTFSGDILTKDQYDQFELWFDKRRRGPFIIRDHFGRRYDVTAVAFDPQPKQSIGKAWRHTYTCTVLVHRSPTAATVGEVAP